MRRTVFPFSWKWRRRSPGGLQAEFIAELRDRLILEQMRVSSCVLFFPYGLPPLGRQSSSRMGCVQAESPAEPLRRAGVRDQIGKASSFDLLLWYPKR